MEQSFSGAATVSSAGVSAAALGLRPRFWEFAVAFGALGALGGAHLGHAVEDAVHEIFFL